ncbi:MAG: FlgD immunoglobulin-like domain containing protein [bacterium]
MIATFFNLHSEERGFFILLAVLLLGLAQGNDAVWAQSPPIGGFAMPSLEDEKETYRKWGWSWDASIEPNVPENPNYTVQSPDIHGSTEGDDLWTYLMMYLRTGEPGYLDRARAWARYFKEDYRKCIGTSFYSTFCHDRDGFLMDHLYGWGLVAWYEYTGDTAALAEAESLCVELEAHWSTLRNNAWPLPGEIAMGSYGLRQGARHLLLATRVAEVTKKQRWVTLRDRLIALWLQSPDWDPRGMYFAGEWSTDEILYAGAYAAGARVQASYHMGVLTEAFAHAYRITGRQRLRDRLVAMARFVDRYGMDSTYQYTGRFFGIVNGSIWHNYAAVNPVTFWDPAYTISLVNTLMWGYLFENDQRLYDRAKYFFNRGTKGIYGQPIQRAAGDTEVHHFVDTRFASSTGHFYLDYNKGELRYTYLIFSQQNGLPTAVAHGSTGAQPAEFVLEQNHPNPFLSGARPSILDRRDAQTMIRFSLTKDSHVQMRIYNLMGQLMRTLLDEQRPLGEHRVLWDGKDDHGELVPGGLYFYEMRSGAQFIKKKLLLLR